jgi:hypothetical protein
MITYVVPQPSTSIYLAFKAGFDARIGGANRNRGRSTNITAQHTAQYIVESNNQLYPMESTYYKYSSLHVSPAEILSLMPSRRESGLIHDTNQDQELPGSQRWVGASDY